MTTTRTGSSIGGGSGIRIAGWAAILYFLLPLVAALTLTGELNLPFPGAASDEVVIFFEGLVFDAAFVTGSIMLTAATVLWLVFAARIAYLVLYFDAGFRWVGYRISDAQRRHPQRRPRRLVWGSPRHRGLLGDKWWSLHR
jgi:hypothetical protein